MSTKGIIKGNEEAFGSDKYIHDLDHSDDYVSVFMCQNILNYIF